MNLSVDTLVAQYRILEKVGEGGWGAIYKALDTQLDRVVALKFLTRFWEDATAYQRFVQEARVTAKFEHPNACVVHALDVWEDQPYIVMEYIEGETLSALIQKESREDCKGLGLDRAYRFALELAEVLQEAHASGITHRDIKANNIMISRRGHVKVLDFGLAKLKDSTNANRTVGLLGTPAYMSPEQARGEEVDHRTDIYSFGVVFYEMLTGVLPFKAASDVAMLRKILDEEPVDIRKVNPEVDEFTAYVVMRCLEKNPELRYGSMEELRQDLQRMFPAVSRQSLTGIPPAPPRRRTRSRTLFLSLGMLAVVGIVAAYVFLNPEPTQRVSLAVVDFNNETAESDLDGLSGMLITALEQSQQFEVLTRAGMFDVLNQLGKTHVERIDETLGREICRKANVALLAIASIRKFGNLYHIDLKVLDPNRDEYLFTSSEKGTDKQSIPAMIDRLSVKTHEALKTSVTEVRPGGKSVGDITSVNLEAYQHYFTGEQYISKLNFEDAERELKRAIALDSTFALAHYRLAYVYSWHIDPRREESSRMAMRYLNKAPEKERILIRALDAYINGNIEQSLTLYRSVLEQYPQEKEAHWQIGDISFHNADFDVAIPHFRTVLEIDPRFGLALNHILIALSRKERLDDMLTYARQYVEVEPTEQAYNFLAGTHMMRGEYEQARATYHAASNLFPKSLMPTISLADIHTFRGEYAEAEKILVPLLEDSNERSTRRHAMRKLAALKMYQGKVVEAIRALDRIIQLDQASGNIQNLSFTLAEKAFWESAAGRPAEVIEPTIKKTIALLDTADFRTFYYLAKTYRHLNQRERMENIISTHVVTRMGLPLERYGSSLIQAYRFAESGDYVNAAEQLGEFYRKWGMSDPLFNPNDLARWYIKANRTDNAIALLIKFQKFHFDGWWPNYISSRAAYYPESFLVLAMAHEQKRERVKAITALRALLQNLKHCDEGLPLARKAREQLARLSMNP